MMRPVTAFRGWRRAGLAGLMLAITAMPAAAHPDIAVTLRLLFNLNGAALTGIGESWTFDTRYSRALIDRFDHDRDGAFAEDEKQALRQRLVADLGGGAFLNTLTAGDETVALGDPAGFDAAIHGPAVTVTFAFNLDAPIGLENSQASLMVRDESYIAAFRLADRYPVMLRGDRNGSCLVRSEAAPDAAYFAGLVVPDRFILSCKPAR